MNVRPAVQIAVLLVLALQVSLFAAFTEGHQLCGGAVALDLPDVLDSTAHATLAKDYAIHHPGLAMSAWQELQHNARCVLLYELD